MTNPIIATSETSTGKPLLVRFSDSGRIRIYINVGFFTFAEVAEAEAFLNKEAEAYAEKESLNITSPAYVESVRHNALLVIHALRH